LAERIVAARSEKFGAGEGAEQQLADGVLCFSRPCAAQTVELKAAATTMATIRIHLLGTTGAPGGKMLPVQV